MEKIAIIPARSGSKGVPGKNIYPVGGHPLIAYTIAAAVLSRGIERVIVSTDSEEIAGIARDYGAEVPFLRPLEFAQDNSPDREYLLHAMQWFQDNEGHVPEYWVHLRPTTPLREVEIVDQAILEIMKHPEATSLRSGHPVPESPFKWFRKDANGYFKGIRPDDHRPEYYNLPRQAFPPIYVPDGYVDILKASFILNSESLHGDKIFGFVSPSCVEVDSKEELEILEFQLSKKGSHILDYLNRSFP